MKQCAANYMWAEDINDKPILWRYQFKENELNAFCEQLCREQRERCEDEIYKLNIWIDNGLIAEVVKNSPMPKL